MTNLFIVLPIAAIVAIVETSLFEWVYHRYWLHRPWLPPQMFTAHTLVHHQLCKHEDTFHVTEEEQEEALTFQWWGGPVLVSIILSPWLLLAVFDRFSGIPWWPVVATIGVIGFLYYFAYEGFHYLMHKPSIPWIERTAVFRFMKHHHQLHHVYMGKNFNVVLPLADLLLGTLVLADPLPPKVTEPAARVVARRHSRWGRRLRAGTDVPETLAPPIVHEQVPLPPEP